MGTAHGKRLTGFAEISAFTHTVLPGTVDHDVTATHEVEHILFVRPDVAAVKVGQRPVTRDGKRLDGVFRGQADPAALVAGNPEAVPGTPLCVLAEDDGVRWVAAAQNTKVMGPATPAAR
ncbi:hypothetical protein [Streptomyces sp. NPDC000229]|uniref:hypothetical protein n=1 Tax=Streptomyces sp. NPDC000229 TaxID=3154247 RepID=UPI0033174F22